MKKTSLFIMLGLVFLMNACGSKDPIQQKWKVNDVKVPNVKALMKLAPMLSQSNKLSHLIPKSVLDGGSKALIIEMLKQTTFEFKADNKCIVNIFGKNATGTYRLSKDKKTLTINSDDIKMGNKMDVKSLSANQLIFDMHLEGQAITFVLVPA
ncbi:hypothetical protein [uncultured Microscilla sp.]|uniref:hypothetical protein n=1 Tax=uncultured Microscilla sp. TaxID=432653 RepID=UPI00263029D7|nr:hypothetical protein [uncultured Microscilla sp.]